MIKKIVAVLAILMSGYHLYAGAFGAPEAMMHRSVHLSFTLVLIFLVGFTNGGKRTWGKNGLDIFLLLLTILSLGYVFLNYEYIVTRYPYVHPVSIWDFAMGVILTLILLEASRRMIGLALPLTAIGFLLYALFGSYLPGLMRHTGFPVETIIDQLYLTTEGIFGIPLGVSATYVILFVIFGAFLEQSGTGQFFMDFATSLVGGAKGGPGKISCVSSSLFGTISGSAVANVMVDGWLTIPLMKRTGFKHDFAAAVEATASTGGQIMPPVMGAAAFVIAEYTGISYINICKHALIPALLYYLALFMAIHFEASRTELFGVPKEERPRLKSVIVTKGHLFIPLVVIIYFMLAGYTPMYACIYATIAVVLIALVRADTRMGLMKIVGALEFGAKNMLPVAAACACAGIVVGVINLTGLGLKFTSLILFIAGDSLAPALIFTMIAGIILGMGLPTTAAYIVQAALLIPALIKLGVPVIAAHLFVFYFAIISAITPPVAMAVYAAAGISGSNIWKTGIEAMKIGATGFVVPFMFVYGPSLLLIGSPGSIITTIISASIGVVLLSAGLMGWLLKKATLLERAMLVIGAIFLIKPGLWTDLIGLGLLVGVILLQKFKKG
ncbi:MAG: TRAP transporter permease [Deltaproteobacteria bacterium]|nr:TRAP transporter permease [Deltaproteobacteria bacterium]MBM4324132.1 TRAP transporter permease [Deltaproteobacteria bacterium]